MSHASFAAGFTESALTRRVDEIRAADRADDQDHEAGQDRTERDHPQDRAAAASRQPEGDGPERQGNEPEPHAEHLQQLGQVLRRLQLIRLHDLDPAGVGPEPLGDVADDRHLVAELDHERPQVEDHRTVLGADPANVVVEDSQQLCDARA